MADSLEVVVGDQINFCYTVTNQTLETLEFHDLVDSLDGVIFSDLPQTLAPTESFQFNRMVTAGTSGTYDATWTAATELPGYSFDDAAPFDFIDISTTGTALGLTDDGEVGITLPFQFEFYGQLSDQLCVGNNGAIIFGVDTCAIAFTNATLPATGVGALIAPFWDDIDDELGDVYWEVQGSAPDRVAIVQWHERPHFSTETQTDTMTVQVLLFEGSNEVLFQYQDVSFANPAWDGGASATIGLQSDGGATANLYSFDTASVTDGAAILWTASNPVEFSASDSVSLDVGAPVISVTPPEVDAQTDPGTSTTVNLEIANTGDRDLEWEIDEAQRNTRSHFPAGQRYAPIPLERAVATDHDAGADPQQLERKAGMRRAGGALPLGTAVPAYSTTSFSRTDYVSLDATDPTVLNTIVDPAPGDIFAATFIDNDFSNQFAIASGTAGTLPPDTFGTLDTATGAFTTLGTITGGPAGATWTSAKWDASSGTLYAMAVPGGGDNQLFEIDPVTGAATLVGSIAGSGVDPGAIVIAIALSPEGDMYGIDIIGDVLLAIDKSDASAAVIGPTGVDANFAQDMDFDPQTGTLYWAGYLGGGNSQMFTVDLATGTATSIGLVADGAELPSFSIALPQAGGGCSAAEDIPWLSASPAQGTIAPGNPADISTVTLDATALTEGYYRANLCVRSNDPASSTVAVPVEFIVGNPPPEEADLQLTLSSTPDPVLSGETVSIVASVENLGPQGVDDAILEVSLPVQLSFESAGGISGPGSWSCSAEGQDVTCEFAGGPLASGETAEVQIDATVDALTPSVGIDVTGSVESTTYPDPVAANNEDTLTIQVEPASDELFADGFECPEGEPDCGLLGEPGVYDDRARFLDNVADGYFEEDFSGVAAGSSPPLDFTDGTYSYTVSAAGEGSNNLFNEPGIISTDSALDSIVVTFTGAPVTAVGGNFWATDISVQPTGTDITLTLSDGTVETFTSTGPTDFRGFVTEEPITSITIEAPDTPDPIWPTMTNLIVGER